ncbi:MAG TPA: DUF1428 domain-containing protein [Burkholderiales bacterium]|nr:DUF1428 domain-containing protein [Burkholderiales bacterium]
MAYVDGFLLAIPKKNREKYKRIARLAAKVWMEHGAIAYVEAVADDVKPGKLTSFPQAVKLKKGEEVWFSYIVYRNRAARDRILKKVMADKRLSATMQPGAMPFDMKRMIWGGFKAEVER